MNKAELKDLYAEELTLLKRIHDFLKEQKTEKAERVEKVTLLLLFRICSSLYSALLLTVAAFRKNSVTVFKLSIGIVLRCAFTDCIFSLYIQRVDRNRACEELDIRTIDYANSLLDRREVYRDQVKSAEVAFDDDFIDKMWESTMEDFFLHLLDFDATKEGLKLTKQSKSQLKAVGFSNVKSLGIKEQKDFLINQERLEKVANQLYHYYKYFSQYEHFSENGQGDVLASLEDGNDNIHFPSAIRALSSGVEEVIKYLMSSV